MTVEQRRQIGTLRGRVTRHRRALQILGDDPFIGAGQVGELLGVLKTNVRRDVSSGKIPAPTYELPGGPVWLRAEIELERALRDQRAAAEADGEGS